jgi:hypothetical protein
MGGPSGIAYSIRISIVDYQSGEHPCHIQPFQILSFQAFVAWSYHDAEVFPTIPYSQRIMTVIFVLPPYWRRGSHPSGRPLL